jgi:transcriptional regulator with XRE-family HTH domain
MSDESGRRIRAARGYGKKSQPDIAKVLEVSDGTVKNIELGRREPKRSELLAIAEACEVPMWFLEGGWDGWRKSVDEAGRAALRDIEQGENDRRSGGGRG